MRSVACAAVIVIHWLVALAVLAVPIFAIGSATLASFDRSHVENLSDIGLHRWPLLLANTSIVVCVAIALAATLGVAAGALTGRTNLVGRGLARAGVSFLACIPPFLVAAFAFAVVPAWATPQSPWLCGVYYGVTYAPLAALVMHARLRGVDEQLESAARLDASPAVVFWRVTLPQASGGIAAICAVLGLLVLTDFSIADLLQVRTFAREVYSQRQITSWPPAPLLTGAPAFLAVFVLIALGLRRAGRQRDGSPDVALAPTPYRLPHAGQLGGWMFFLAWFSLFAGTIVAVARFVRPVANVAHYFGSAAAVLARTLELSLAAAIAMTVLSVGYATALTRTRAGRRFGNLPLALLLAMPASVAGVAIIGLLNRPGWLGDLLDSPAAVAIGYVVRFLPVAVLLLSSAVARIPVELEWLARSDGADWLALQRHVFWPGVRRDAAVAVLVLMVLALGEAGCTVLLRPPGREVVSAWIFTELHKGLNGDVAIMSLASCMAILTVWAALLALLRPRSTFVAPLR
jgi:ABC-type Fe3+ transport system permease subunit